MSQPAKTVASPNGRRRWLWTALLLSLAVNAVFVGIALRTLWHVRNANFMSVGTIDRRLPGFVKSLPDDRRTKLRDEAFQRNRQDLRPMRRALRQARTDAARAFTADPFDRQAFAAAEARLAEAESNLRRAVRDRLGELGEQLTVEERRAFLRWMRPGRGGRFRQGGWRHERDDRPAQEP